MQPRERRVFHFNLAQFAAYIPPVGVDGELELPVDLLDVIGSQGDQFRDPFTRLCLYLAYTADASSGGQGSDQKRSDETVVIGTEYGNTAALANLQRQAASAGKMLSARYFPNATSSSASAFVNMGIGATGRNMTLNAGILTPVVALWQALFALDCGRSGRSRILVGDIYSREAARDIAQTSPEMSCNSGLVHALFTVGDDFEAEFHLGAARLEDDSATDRRSICGSGTYSRSEDYGRNGAHATAEFLHSLVALTPGAHHTLEFRSPSNRTASITVTRKTGGEHV